MMRQAAAAGSAVQEHERHAIVVAAGFPVQRMPRVDGEPPRRVGVDLGKENLAARPRVVRHGVESMQENANLGDRSWRTRRSGGPIIDEFPRSVSDDGSTAYPPHPRGVPSRGCRPRAPRSGASGCPTAAGPALVRVTKDAVIDLSRVAPTSSGLLEQDDPVAAIRGACFRRADRIDSPRCSRTRRPTRRDDRLPIFLAPCDLQAIKASRRHVRVEHARARDRGAGARRSGEGRERAGVARRASSATIWRACGPARRRRRASRTR